jgi:hypothetical protein
MPFLPVKKIDLVGTGITEILLKTALNRCTYYPKPIVKGGAIMAVIVW